ncbi:PREDICTED: sodium channel protein Nach [Papilio polytes]|uniref:sodium channel protein Nach n=1 Tax=Papilio polytes TaxID=76194 RepID=UPI000676AB67|nr:PREDICTED: sodium channel protein Nach [Papilio polytes]
MYRETCKSYFEIWWNGIKSLPETTSIHGFRFIGDNNRHWTERIFWLIFVALCWFGSSLLIAAQYDAYQNYPISFVVETTYKDWNTYFPSIAICENDNMRRIEAVSDRLFGQDHDFNIEEVIKELSYYKGFTYFVSEFCSEENPLLDCDKWNLTYYANVVRSPCEEMLKNCSWNNVQFPCCKIFNLINTEFGVCYIANSIQVRQKRPKFHMVSNKTTGPGVLNLHVIVPAKLYVTNEEEVPSLTIIGLDAIQIEPETSYRRIISIRNIENDAGARVIEPAKRKCRYVDENFLDVYPYYSYTACTVQCRKNAQLKTCNCTSFYMLNVKEEMKCDINGLICLNDHATDLSALKAKWSSRPGLDCDCLPSCTEAEISIVKDFKTTTTESYASVQIELAALPSERYRRNVVRGFLDLVVSTGGTGGLFLGVSILSFVELLYILLIRPFCDIYSRLDDDPWYKRFGAQHFNNNNFKPKLVNRKKSSRITKKREMLFHRRF